MTFVYPLCGFFPRWQTQVGSAELLCKSRTAFVRQELMGSIEMNEKGLHFEEETRTTG